MTDRLYVFDTGPLLCFGGFPGGAKLLAGRYHGRGCTTGDVDRELRGLRRSTNPIIAAAADHCVQKFSWLERRAFNEADDLEVLRELRDRLATFQRVKRDVSESAIADFGECSVLLLAERLADDGSNVVAVINEDPARRLARSLDLPSVCFAEVVKAMCVDGDLTTAAAFDGCQKLKRGFVDIGDVVESPRYFVEAPAA
ncbi:MAG: hypothetical protein OXP08_13390 [bacterium]|nr:hypothetical protein [bacterium]